MSSLAVQIDQYPPLSTLVETMVKEDNYPREELVTLLEAVEIDNKILSLMGRQYEAKPWYEYREIFINERRVKRGVVFFNKNKKLLDKAYKKYGVSPSIITAIIGVETHYGRHTGNKKVLNSLITLSAEYPRRSEFFTKELRFFLNMTREEGIDPSTVMGSYAGAIGIPQFMPSSYTNYAVDFNDNAKRDLVNEISDVIGSIAHYLHVHGWVRDQAIYAGIKGEMTDVASALVTKRAKPRHTIDRLLSAGIQFDTHKASDKASLFKLEEKDGNRYVVGYRNFYAITRYNISNNYAMAVSNLAEKISNQIKN